MKMTVKNVAGIKTHGLTVAVVIMTPTQTTKH